MKQEINCSCCDGPCTAILPGGADVCVGRDDCKVQANITVDRVRSVMIWGVVTDRSGAPVAGALVRLLRYTGECGTQLRELCITRTDGQGYYQFDLERNCEGRYRVVVSSCAPCENGGSSPCGERRGEPCAPWDDCGNRCGQYGAGSRVCRSAARNQILYY